MMNQEISECLSGLALNGYYIFENVVPKMELELMQYECGTIRDLYSEDLVKTRLFYRREDSHNRQGDAIMVDVESNSLLPHLNISGISGIEKYFNLYNRIIQEAIGKRQNPGESRTMLNIQSYSEDSLEVFDHYDGEFMDYEHVENTKHGGYDLKIKRGLLPRYVMVVVLYNENEGAGTYVRHHDSDERIPLHLYPGDILIFDNIRMRHGVPSLKKRRMMLGFRNFDFYPKYFENSPEGGNGWKELQDTSNPGWILDIPQEEVVKVQIDFNKKWKETLYEENLKQRPAF